MTKTVTINAQTYDVYQDVAGADLYLQADFTRTANWDALDTDQKSQALVSATRRLDRLNWAGQKTVDTQPLEFPRTGLVDKDGNPVDSGTVPTEIEDGTSLLAYIITQDAAADEEATTSSNTKKVAAGPASVEFFRPERGGRLPDPVLELVGIFLESGTPSASTGGLATGTDGKSDFCEAERYPLKEGWS